MYRRAFSLLELVVVLLMLGALTTMAIGQYLDSQKLSKRSIFESNINEIAKALSSYRSNKVLLGTNTVLYPTSLSDPQFKMLFEQEPRNPYTSKPMLTDNSVDSGIQYVSDGTSYKLCVVQRDVDDVNNNGVVEEVLPLSTKTACIGNTQTSVGVTFARNSIAYTSNGAQVGVNVPRFEQGKFGQAVMVEEGTTNLLGSYSSFEIDSNSDGLADGWITFIGGDGIDPTRVVTKTRVQALYHGSYAQRIEINNVSYSNKDQGLSVGVAISPNISYTLSAYIKTNAMNKVYVGIRWYDSNNNTLGDILSSKIQTPNAITRLSVSGTSPSNAAKCTVYIRGISANGEWFEVDAVQLEAKPYATSFIDGTRSPETLTIPTAGVLNPQEGTIEFWVYPLNTVKTLVYDRSLFASASSQPGVFYCNITPNQQLRFVYDNNGTNVELVGGTIPNLSWSYITVRWNASGVAYFVNGKLVASSTKPITSINGTSLYIGCWGTLHANALFDDLRISSRARTDAEIQAAYRNNQSLPVDAWTTLKLDFNGDLSTQSGVIP